MSRLLPQPDPESEEFQAISIYDVASKFSVFNMLPVTTKAGITRISPELRAMNEEKLRKHVEPDGTLCRLRISFWDEYERAKARGIAMALGRVVHTVCTRDYWDEVIVTAPSYLAWILCPPKDYELALKELLDLGLERLREIVSLPFHDPKTGRLSPALVAQVLAAITMLQNRVKGEVIKRIAIKQQSEHHHSGSVLAGTGGKRGEALIAPRDDFGIEGTMEQLEALEKKLESVGARLEQRKNEYVVSGGKDHLDFEPSERAFPTELRPTTRDLDAEEGEYFEDADPEDIGAGV